MSNKKNVTIAASRSLCLYLVYTMSGVDFNSNFLNLQHFRLSKEAHEHFFIFFFIYFLSWGVNSLPGVVLDLLPGVVLNSVPGSKLVSWYPFFIFHSTAFLNCLLVLHLSAVLLSQNIYHQVLCL